MGVRVLIAEDDERLRAMLRRGLHYGGFEVVEAQDGEVALRIALAQRPDLVVLDIAMPKRSSVLGRGRERSFPPPCGLFAEAGRCGNASTR